MPGFFYETDQPAMARPDIQPQSSRPVPSHPATAPLSIDDMTVAYDRKPVLWDIDYDAPPQKLIAIVGPNGAGKSTLIKASLGLIPAASGVVTFFGKPYDEQRERIVCSSAKFC